MIPCMQCVVHVLSDRNGTAVLQLLKLEDMIQSHIYIYWSDSVTGPPSDSKPEFAWRPGFISGLI